MRGETLEMISLPALRAEAETLARQLPGALLQADAADISHPGAAGRKRAGSGEQFWQYRRYAQTDAADRIDWRRSARSHEYFVRETELESARTILFWADPHAGFDWSGDPARDTKADRARALILALAILLAKAGERVGTIGGARPPALGSTAADRLAEDLLAGAASPLTPPRAAAIAVIASDFYDPVETWRQRLSPLVMRCRTGVLLAVSDPVEHTFPFSGRTRFSRPGSPLSRIFGRAEAVREAYLDRFEAQAEAIRNMAAGFGWNLVHHRTDSPALQGAARLKAALEQFGAQT